MRMYRCENPKCSLVGDDVGRDQIIRPNEEHPICIGCGRSLTEINHYLNHEMLNDEEVMYKCVNEDCERNEIEAINWGTKLTHGSTLKTCLGCGWTLIQFYNPEPLSNFDDAGKRVADDIDKEILDTIESDAEFLDEKTFDEKWGDRVVDMKKREFEVCQPDDNVTEWMEIRDEVNASFINLRSVARDINAHHTEDRLIEINREMLNMLYTAYKVGD